MNPDLECLRIIQQNDSDFCNHHDICYGRSADQKMLDVWKDAKESAEIFGEKEREEKEEERRRLYFPGNYTKLFYQMVWHNFKYDWKDYGLLLFCGVIVSAFSLQDLEYIR